MEQTKRDRLQVYEAPDGARGHVTGAWYFCPVSWDANFWAFSRPHETAEMASVGADAWAARFQTVN
jgi:hypothetical protein